MMYKAAQMMYRVEAGDADAVYEPNDELYTFERITLEDVLGAWPRKLDGFVDSPDEELSGLRDGA